MVSIRRSGLVALLGGACLIPRPVVAQAQDSVLTSLVDEALAHNPDLAAAREALTAARTRPGQARALPDPMLGLTYTNDGWSPSLGSRDMTTLGLMWSQDLPFPGK